MNKANGPARLAHLSTPAAHRHVGAARSRDALLHSHFGVYSELWQRLFGCGRGISSNVAGIFRPSAKQKKLGIWLDQKYRVKRTAIKATDSLWQRLRSTVDTCLRACCFGFAVEPSVPMQQLLFLLNGRLQRWHCVPLARRPQRHFR